MMPGDSMCIAVFLYIPLDTMRAAFQIHMRSSPGNHFPSHSSLDDCDQLPAK